MMVSFANMGVSRKTSGRKNLTMAKQLTTLTSYMFLKLSTLISASVLFSSTPWLITTPSMRPNLSTATSASLVAI